MNQTFSRQWAAAAAVALTIAALANGCTMKSQEAPKLTGPSELGTSVSVSVSPDVLTQDGGSQSLVTVTAYDQNGKPLRNLSLRSEIVVAGVVADFGSLSARSIATGSDGRATLVYTAPPATAGPAVDNGTTVTISVTPIGSDFGNSVPRLATIRLVPPGVVVPPDGLQPRFTVSSQAPKDHESVIFDASTSTAPSTNPITAYSWDFGDGLTGTGRVTTHSYNRAGVFVAKLTVLDGYNRNASTSQAITVSGGTNPTASFVYSPSSPRVREQVNFNGTNSRAAAERSIRSYQWDFGDGEQKTTTSALTTHDFVKAGEFAVTLQVTDDVGRTSDATTTKLTVADGPIASFSISPTDPFPGTVVNFNASASNTPEGQRIVSYAWDFGDGQTRTTSGPLTTHAYAAPGAYNATLIVTDDAGRVSKPTTTGVTVKLPSP